MKLARRTYTDADVFEALVDGLANGVDYTVTVTALTGHPDVEGPASEPRTVTPASAAGDTEGTPDPVPALPLAGAGVLAGLLASSAFARGRLSPPVAPTGEKPATAGGPGPGSTRRAPA